MEQNINPGLAVIGLSGTRPWTLIRGNVVSELLWEKGKTACLVFNITIATGPFSNQSLFSQYFSHFPDERGQLQRQPAKGWQIQPQQ